MQIIKSISDMRQALADEKEKRIGLVPTMGYLHEGHLSLVRRAKAECERVVMSIFVNPIQFGPNEDYERYPRDLERDAQLAKEAGVDYLFAPSVEEMYPEELLTRIVVSQITEPLCGASRPGHFEGVTTVVAKLFHIVQPDRAYFGLKDAQQVAVIERMVRDLNFPIEIVACPTVREKDGLALSSRNVYLSPEERRQALSISRALQEVKRLVEAGQLHRAEEGKSLLRERISSQPLARIDYIEVLSFPDLKPVKSLTQKRVLVAVAVYFGSTRLIDNLLLNE